MISYSKIKLDFGRKTILDDFSLEIAKGEKIVLLGKSGIGKSSIFGLMLGFIVPERGKVFFDGKPVDKHTVWDIRQKIAFVDQDVSIGDYKVSDWFSFVADLRANHSLDFSGQKVKGLMDRFELSSDLFDKNIFELSGGERQRVAIIVSVLLGRKVFLLDEVTSALDKNLKEKTADFFTKHEDWTVVSISHDAVWLDNPKVKVFDLEKKAWKQ
jgi:putative ABC transport system ATP-binding protein